MPKKIVIIGGVACGPKAASRARRRDPDAEITIIERGQAVSYAGCGLPYFISGVVPQVDDLMKTGYGVLRDAAYFDRVKKIRILARHEAVAIDRAARTVTVRNLADNTDLAVPYDLLVLATGSAPVRPPFPGIDLKNVVTLRRPDEAGALRGFIDAGIERVALIGAGRVGLEVAEAMSNQGVETVIIDVANQVLPGSLDPDMARLVEQSLRAEKVSLFLGEKVTGFVGEGGVVTKVLTDQREFAVGAVLVGVGVRPEIALAKAAGIEIGVTGAIRVDEYFRTSDPNIFAGGDCSESRSIVTGRPAYIPLGSTANRQGRTIGDNLTGHPVAFPGVVGTGIMRTLGTNIASTGITETQARALGLDVITCLSPSGDRSHFYPGGKNIVIKLVAEKTGRLLGAQIVGPGDVARRIDTVAATLTLRGTIDDLGDMDLAYAPPFGSAIEAVSHAANILRNKRDGLASAVSPAEFFALLKTGATDFFVLDVRTAGELVKSGQVEDPRMINIPIEELRGRVGELPAGKRPLIVCGVGQRAYEAQRFLQTAGFADAAFVEGGWNILARFK